MIGNGVMVLPVFVLFFFNIFGEELYWRGILLPQQELVHGVMWHLFHLMIFPWYLIFGLPIALAISFVAQRTGNTWMAILLHGQANFTLYGLMVGVIMGV